MSSAVAHRRGRVLNLTNLPAPAGPNWNEAVSSFAAICRAQGRRARTIELHLVNLEGTRRDLAALGGGPVSLQEITTGDLQDMIRAMVDRGLAARTINIRLQSVKAFFAFLTSRGWLAVDPAAPLDRHREDRRLPRTLASHEQLALLLAQPDRGTFPGLRDYTMMLLQLDCGLRLGELLGLTLTDTDLGRRLVRVRPENNKVHQEREIPFTTPTRDALRVYIQERGALDTDRLFVSRDNNPLAPNSYQQNLGRYAARAGLGAVSPHTLRHTFARLYLINGGEGVALKKLLGHNSMDMTDWYVQLWGQDLSEMHEQHSPILRLPLPPANAG